MRKLMRTMLGGGENDYKGVDFCVKIEGAADGNRAEKLAAFSKSLASAMRIDADFCGCDEFLAKWKYREREWKNGKWCYKYGDEKKSKTQRRIEVAKKAPLIEGVAPLKIDTKNWRDVARQEFQKLKAKIGEGLYCGALDGRQIAGVVDRHLTQKRGKDRTPDEIYRRLSLFPFISPIVEKCGRFVSKTKSPKYKNCFDYEIVGHANIDGKEKAISVVLSDYIKDGKKLTYISVFDTEINTADARLQRLGKTLSMPDISGLGSPAYPPADDIMIPEIEIMSIDSPQTFEIYAQGVNEANKVEKFEKAVTAAAKALSLPVKVEKGERFLLPAQQEFFDGMCARYEAMTAAVYDFLCDALDLPKCEIETRGAV